MAEDIVCSRRIALQICSTQSTHVLVEFGNIDAQAQFAPQIMSINMEVDSPHEPLAWTSLVKWRIPMSAYVCLPQMSDR